MLFNQLNADILIVTRNLNHDLIDIFKFGYFLKPLMSRSVKVINNDDG